MAQRFYHDEGIVPIDRIEFTILKNEEIKTMSVFGKETDGLESYETYENMQPVVGGLLDPRMGVTDNFISCWTCGLKSTDCPGHYGHITLARYIVNKLYIEYIKKILECVCLRCAKLLINRNDSDIINKLKNKKNKNLLNEIAEESKKVQVCGQNGKTDGCGTPTSKLSTILKKNNNSDIQIYFSTQEAKGKEEEDIAGKKLLRVLLSPKDCFEIFSKIRNADLEFMGFNSKVFRPENMIFKEFIIPPVAVRPSARLEFLATGVKEDTLTIKIKNIFMQNQRLKKTEEEKIVEADEENPFYQWQKHNVYTFIENDKSGKDDENGKSISSRLKGKDGRIRHNLMGKRVDFSARTVITPDPNIGINELGVPLKIAMNLTKPEIVTEHNVERLEKLVRNGAKNYPGAKWVCNINGTERNWKPLEYTKNTKQIKLRVGDIVERHLQTGDWVLLNRQPTLHKLSMMGHQIRVIPDKDLLTLRLNVAVTKPYNADQRPR